MDVMTNFPVHVRKWRGIKHKVSAFRPKIRRSSALLRYAQFLGKYLQFFSGPRSIYTSGEKQVTSKTDVRNLKTSLDMNSIDENKNKQGHFDDVDKAKYVIKNDKETCNHIIYVSAKRQGIKFKAKAKAGSKLNRNNNEKIIYVVHLRIKRQGIKFKAKARPKIVFVLTTEMGYALFLSKYRQFFTGPRAIYTKARHLIHDARGFHTEYVKLKRIKLMCSWSLLRGINIYTKKDDLFQGFFPLRRSF